MGHARGKHPAEEEGQGESKGPQVQEEGHEPIQMQGEPLPPMWTMQRVFSRRGLCRMYQLP